MCEWMNGWMGRGYVMSDRTNPEKILTAAELLRRSVRVTPHSLPSNTSNENFNKPDLDEEIRKLEEELQKNQSSSTGGSDSLESDSDDEGDNSSTSNRSDPGKPAVLSMSAVKDERIEHLPAELLPKMKSRTLKGIDASDDSIARNAKKHKSIPGLEAAVKEVLQGYTPRSAERLPFYCRVCAKQYDNESDFFQHRETLFHKTALELERKASYCRLCRKQLTSPVQLQEHLKSRPHQERLQTLKFKQKGGARQLLTPK